MKSDRGSGMNGNDMMKNFEFLDHNECLLEMQIFVLLFVYYIDRVWQEDMGFNKNSNIF